MRFSCTQENLLHGLGIVSRVASRAGNLPILSHIYIKAEVEGIVFKATNLEVGVSTTVRGKVEEIGEFTVPARLLTEYVLLLPKEKVDLALEGQNLTIKSGVHQTKVKGLPAADFPLIPPVEEGTVARVSLPALAEGLEQVLCAVSATETRPEISGVLFRVEGKQCVLAGTDSYRLAEKVLNAEGVEGKPVQAIVPLRALQELARICSQEKEAGSVVLTLSPNQFAARLPTLEFVSRVIDGQYPDYRAIVPNKFGSQLLLSRAELIAAVKAAGLFSKAGVYDIGIETDPQAGIVTISALNSQTGEYVSTLPAEVKGGSAKLAFNWKYLLEGVGVLPGEKIWLKATDSSAPAMLSEEGGSDYFYLLMPIKE